MSSTQHKAYDKWPSSICGKKSKSLSTPAYMFHSYQIYCIWYSQACTLSKLLQKNFKTVPACACIIGWTCILVSKYKRSCNMQWWKKLGALCPYINNSNKSLPSEKCLLNPFWKAVNLQYTRRPRSPRWTGTYIANFPYLIDGGSWEFSSKYCPQNPLLRVPENEIWKKFQTIKLKFYNIILYMCLRT